MNQRIKKIEKVINTRIGQEHSKPLRFYDIPVAEREWILEGQRRAIAYAGQNRINIDKLSEDEFLAIVKEQMKNCPPPSSH